MSPHIREDAERIAALRELCLLDTPASPHFDCITRLCTAFFDCSMSLISLVDEDRQWFISAEGVAVTETPRDVSFCNHTIAAEQCFAVEDAVRDARFASNPLVLGEPHIRAYLGQPIRGPEGHLLGALCVAHDQPRHFSGPQRDWLASFATVVENLIRAHGERLATTRLNEMLLKETQALRKSNHLLRQAERVGRIGAWELNLETRSLRFSDEMYALSGVSEGASIDTQGALEFYREEDRSRVDEAIRHTAQTGLPFDYEADILGADGVVKRIRCVGEKLDGAEDKSARVVGIMQDITSAHHANLALKHAADYDSLTGVYNRHAFDRCLLHKITEYRLEKHKLSLLLIDLDGFKDINDTFGHVTGDVVLEEISRRLARVTDEGTVLARWGGDEFAILPPLGSSLIEVSGLAEKVLAAVGSQVEVARQKLQLSATCGVAWFENGMQPRELVRRADLALYEGKKRERSAVHFYHPKLEETNKARQIAIAEVRSALDGDRVFAAYQPIVNLANGALLGFEALLRLNTKEGCKLAAGEVLPALLDRVLSREITGRMVRSICADTKALQKVHPDLQFVSINVAESDLLSRGFAPKLLSALAAAGLPEHMVTLEITETMLLVNDNGTVRKVLNELHAAGIEIALDDFGTGFSSLSHLREFPIDKVKIDSSFVQAMTHDRQARAIVHAIVAMAKNLGIQIIAEGIETEEQKRLLQLTGCDFGQGFLFSPALDVGSVTLLGLRNQAGGRERARMRA